MIIEPTLHDILEAINTFASATESRFINLETDISSIKQDISRIESTMATKEDIAAVRAEMATKEGLTNLHDDLVLLARRGNTKLTTLVEELVAKKSLDPIAAKRLLALEPFPQA